MKLFSLTRHKPVTPEVSIPELEEFDMEASMKADPCISLHTDPGLVDEILRREKLLLEHLTGERERIVDEIEYRQRVLACLNVSIESSELKIGGLSADKSPSRSEYALDARAYMPKAETVGI